MQSKVHRSKPKGPGLTRASAIGALHLAQARASIPFAKKAEADCDAGMRFPFRWAGALHSHRWMPKRGGDQASMLSLVPGRWSILLIFERLTNEDAGDHDLVSKP